MLLLRLLYTCTQTTTTDIFHTSPSNFPMYLDRTQPHIVTAKADIPRPIMLASSSSHYMDTFKKPKIKARDPKQYAM